MTFGRWFPLADAVAPDGAGLFQVRQGQGADGLVRYPSGLSAMVFYGADDASLATAFARFRAATDLAQHPDLHVRFATSHTATPSLAEPPRAVHEALRHRADLEPLTLR